MNLLMDDIRSFKEFNIKQVRSEQRGRERERERETFILCAVMLCAVCCVLCAMYCVLCAMYYCSHKRLLLLPLLLLLFLPLLLPLFQCKEVAFCHGGHMFAASNGNAIEVFMTFTAERVTTLRGHQNRGAENGELSRSD